MNFGFPIGFVAAGGVTLEPPVFAAKGADFTTFNSASWNVNIPAPSAAHFDVLVIASGLGTPITSVTAGWTLATSFIDSFSNREAVVYYRDMTGSEGSTVNVSWSSVNTGAATVYAFTGATGIEAVATGDEDVGTTASYLTTTTLGPGRLILHMFAAESGRTSTPGVGWTAHGESSGGASQRLHSRSQAAAGGSVGGTITFSGGTSTSKIVLALVPIGG